jgi:inner membrane protein
MSGPMPTVISHAVVAVALIAAFPAQAVPRRLMLLGAACSMAPDIDVIGFHFGIHYGDLLGHRGLSHSFAFAAVLTSLALLAALPRLKPPVHRGLVWLYLFVATASHGVLDAITDGGLGVAFFSPFDTTRYFFPFTPIAVSPIGADFFSDRGLSILSCEFRWLWLPSIAFAAVALTVRRLLIPHSVPNDQPASRSS